MALKMYLAGAIRDKHPEDIAWRERAISTLSQFVKLGLLKILNPLGGKKYDDKTGLWTMSGVPAKARHIVSQDFWCVDQADIMVVNLTSLNSGYKSIGSLMELGRSTAHSCLRYVILPPEFKGHGNLDMYNQVHPFLDYPMTEVFPDVDTLLEFLSWHVPVMAGVSPRFRSPYPITEQEMDDVLERATPVGEG